MDFNMTSNNQRNIPPKKTDSEPSKATESKFAKAPEAASPKEADASLLQNPIAAGPIWTISGKHKTVTTIRGQSICL